MDNKKTIEVLRTALVALQDAEVIRGSRKPDDFDGGLVGDLGEVIKDLTEDEGNFTVSLLAPSDMDVQDVRVLLQDAVSDFSAARDGDGGVNEYVARRYPGLAGQRFEDKVREVSRRLRWAREARVLDIRRRA